MWRQKIIDFAKQFNHPAWGYTHSERVLKLSLYLAEKQKIKIDEDSLFIASYIHDIGAFSPYIKDGIDHAVRTTQVFEGILKSLGIEKYNFKLVNDIIKGHMFYEIPSEDIEAVIFHDADTLEFMGIIGITRILSIVEIDDWTPDLKTAVELIKKFSVDLPNKLFTPYAKTIGTNRQREMKDYLVFLANESFENIL